MTALPTESMKTTRPSRWPKRARSALQLVGGPGEDEATLLVVELVDEVAEHVGRRRVDPGNRRGVEDHLLDNGVGVGE